MGLLPPRFEFREFERLIGSRAYCLTPREAEILGLYASGLHAPEVARKLDIAESTVRTHLEHVYQKMGVQNGYHSGVRAAYRAVCDGQLSAPDILSDRQQAVCGYVLAGLSNGQIAEVLSITTATVRTHRERIRRKLGVHNGRELVSAISGNRPDAGN